MIDIEQSIEAAARFGADPNGGVTRVAWSPELFAVYSWLRERGAACGFASRIDAAGNLIVRWGDEDEDERPGLGIGSHLDTVPNGGRLDGALGVLAGFEAMRRLQRDGFRPRRPISLIAFMDEEGARFGASLFGSRAFAGDDLSDLATRTDQQGTTLPAAMSDAGYDFDALAEAEGVDRLDTYVELHIEQGPVLDRSGEDLGIVTAICGLVGLRVRFDGEANHAGTTPMSMRRDALAAAARLVTALEEEAARREDVVATVGIIHAHPGGFNVIPGTVELTVDLRAPHTAQIDDMERWVRARVDEIATAGGLDVQVDETHRLAPSPMSPDLMAVIADCATREDVRFREMPSGAGHDAMVLADHVPTGMLFVPSRDGISHNPREHTEPRHCEVAVAVLARTISALTG